MVGNERRRVLEKRPWFFTKHRRFFRKHRRVLWKPPYVAWKRRRLLKALRRALAERHPYLAPLSGERAEPHPVSEERVRVGRAHRRVGRRMLRCLTLPRPRCGASTAAWRQRAVVVWKRLVVGDKPLLIDGEERRADGKRRRALREPLSLLGKRRSYPQKPLSCLSRMVLVDLKVRRIFDAPLAVDRERVCSLARRFLSTQASSSRRCGGLNGLEACCHGRGASLCRTPRRAAIACGAPTLGGACPRRHETHRTHDEIPVQPAPSTLIALSIPTVCKIVPPRGASWR
jgi:hypothetical protein